MFILLASTVVLSACSSYNYYAVSNKPIKQNYKSYAWLPEGKSKAAEIYDNDIATERIIEATSKELDKRGFQLDQKQPDVLIRYTADVNTKTKAYSEPVYYNSPLRAVPRLGFARGRAFYYYSYYQPFPVYVGTEMRKVKIKEGSVMIDLIDRRTSKVIWRGWAEGEVSNPEKALNDLPKVVGNIFKKLQS